MKIKKIRVKNFKSFNDMEMEFGDFNVLIGANASGKSNIIDVFQFIKNISAHGLRNAISMQGGAEYLTNFNSSDDNELSISLYYDYSDHKQKELYKDLFSVELYEMVYSFSLKLLSNGDFSVVRDEILFLFHFLETTNKNEIIDEGSVKVFVKDNTIKLSSILPKNLSFEMDEVFPWFVEGEDFSENTLLLESSSFGYVLPYIFAGRMPEGIGIYDIDPKPIKNVATSAGKADLESDGNNLSIVLNNLLSDKEKKRKYLNLLNDILPFVEDVKVDRWVNNSLLLKMKERYSSKKYSPAFILSDGTINIAALIIALFFEERSLVIFEEPEKGLHPYLMIKLVSLMKDAARKKQVIITTHNPEMIKHAGLENIHLVSRDDEGFTKVSKTSDVEEIQEFLKNEIGIHELMIQNII